MDQGGKDQASIASQQARTEAEQNARCSGSASAPLMPSAEVSSQPDINHPPRGGPVHDPGSGAA